MLPGQETVQQVENARVIVLLSALAIMLYWRMLLRALIVLAAVATAVGAIALLEMVHT
jgi:hypothetical protein